METVVLEKQKPLEHPVVALLLDEYNKGLDEPVYLEVTEEVTCFSGIQRRYRIYQAVGDMAGHYVYIHTLSESRILRFLAQELNKKQSQNEN